MRRVPSVGQGDGGALSNFGRGVTAALSGKLAPGGVMGDGESITGNENTRQAEVTFTKPLVPALAVHDFGFTVYNWTIIGVQPGAVIGRSKRRPTNAGIWLEADLSNVDAQGKFDPPVVATVKMWGTRGEEATA